MFLFLFPSQFPASDISEVGIFTTTTTKKQTNKQKTSSDFIAAHSLERHVTYDIIWQPHSLPAQLHVATGTLLGGTCSLVVLWSHVTNFWEITIFAVENLLPIYHHHCLADRTHKAQQAPIMHPRMISHMHKHTHHLLLSNTL